jgi:tetratricopeptide (TPR) repeat protein
VSAQKEWDKARELWQTAVDRWPREPRFLKGLAAVLLRQQDDQALLPVLEALARLDSDDSLPRRKLASMARDREDWPKAIHWGREALQIDITNASMHRILAVAYEATGRTDLAQHEQAILSRLEE